MSEVKEEAGGRKEGADTALKTKKHTSMMGTKIQSRCMGLACDDSIFHHTGPRSFDSDVYSTLGTRICGYQLCSSQKNGVISWEFSERRESVGTAPP